MGLFSHCFEFKLRFELGKTPLEGLPEFDEKNLSVWLSNTSVNSILTSFPMCKARKLSLDPLIDRHINVPYL